MTVVYASLPGPTPMVRAARYDAVTGQPIDAPFDIAPLLFPDIAMLDSAGDRLVVGGTDFAQVRGNIVDFTGASPIVLPPFTVSTTGGNVNDVPVFASYPPTGAFMSVWENYQDLPGDPVNVRARRFDAQGNPIGNDFLVNQTLPNAQGQPSAAYGPGGLSVIAWAGDAAKVNASKSPPG